MRLDNYLISKNLVHSRNKAIQIIKDGFVFVNENIIKKPSFKIKDSDKITIKNEPIYVSRAAYKLKYFLQEIDIEIENKEILDIGSSTGGFAQILLQYNPKSITCVDVGTNQLHHTLKQNKKIKLFENCDIRDFKTATTFDLITCDISFISLKYVLNSIDNLAKEDIILLFKSQFEVGVDAKRDSKGKVLDSQKIEKAKIEFLNECKKLNWRLIFNQESKIKGKAKNYEEFFYFKK